MISMLRTWRARNSFLLGWLSDSLLVLAIAAVFWRLHFWSWMMTR